VLEIIDSGNFMPLFSVSIISIGYENSLLTSESEEVERGVPP
jgi:hypothetical protein